MRLCHGSQFCWALPLTFGLLEIDPALSFSSSTLSRNDWIPSVRSSKVACFATGFGGSTSSRSSPTTGKKRKSGTSHLVELSNKAKQLLQKYGNNVDAASEDFYREQMSQIQFNKGVSSQELHQARVAAVWDAVALFLPKDYLRTKGKVEPHIDRRLRNIAAVCCDNLVIADKSNRIALLDVGCGDGAIIPYLVDKNVDYTGIDLSSEMIRLGEKRHPGMKFLVGSFPSSFQNEDSSSNLYDVILFNGSLQFFRDTEATLSAAVKLLKPDGKIVLSHVNGAKFVIHECRTNPSVAVKYMPSREMLHALAMNLGLDVFETQHVVPDLIGDLDGDESTFYLKVLSKGSRILYS